MTRASARLAVRVQPRASRNAVLVEADGRIRVAVTAPPVEDAANAALCRVLAEALGTHARAVTLVQGARARDKVVAVDGLTGEEVRARLGAS